MVVQARGAWLSNQAPYGRATKHLLIEQVQEENYSFVIVVKVKAADNQCVNIIAENRKKRAKASRGDFFSILSDYDLETEAFLSV